MAKNKPETNAGSSKGIGKAEINRKRKLLKLLKQQPNNEQITAALANIKYRRKKPKSQEWSKTNIKIAELFKLFTGSASRELFSSNPKIQAAAIAASGSKVFNNLPEGKVSFSLGARAHDKDGNLIWG